MIRFLLCTFTLFLPLQALAVEVLTSIKPIQLIVNELTQEVTTPKLLVAANASPHDYALKPSDVKKVRQADLIVWFGSSLEPFMTKLVSEHSNVLTISAIPSLKLREYQEAHQHDGHDHGSHDPHFWMGIDAVKQVAPAITARLIEIDAQNEEQYKANLKRFMQGLDETDTRLNKLLQGVKERGYYVFHDAYGYFEQQYQLRNLGHFTVSPEKKPGAKTLIEIRNRLAKGDVVCVFAEPQFTPAVIESVMRGSSAKKGVLDPIGTEVTLESGGYFNFLLSMGNDFYQCLHDK
ncbi:TPA: zinc ABC transporter substrate-binding protein ZnuA [Vibrio vulnificus]|nr:zinc ABC transporter substrate-binding protein ZnuA [Vibrio vulnificus]HAS8235292.1 zinc ABC transporter substrate-binding protein ZnuA [Vibrio vulnificus]HAT8510682.1 zinc ABC transporter substrate-binding protein ZnuA [Vibrio vulnificus]HAT8538708.1 zinc ABC transporter substrate-binding protein ZnuA [Vibrio vulnificus]HDY7450352.1 zinc ABC transporter substrate-binding protein ZnuA [Vibrio vulnificus]